MLIALKRTKLRNMDACSEGKHQNRLKLHLKKVQKSGASSFWGSRGSFWILLLVLRYRKDKEKVARAVTERR